MVHNASETPPQGDSWKIRLSTPGQKYAGNDGMDDFREIIQVPRDVCHYDESPWTDSECSLPSDLSKITQRAINVYMLSRKPNGEMGGIGWWQTANGYTAMALHDIWSGDHRNYDATYEAIRECERHHKNLMHPWNDDMLWWGMLCMHMYGIKQDRWFLEQARGIWKHVSKSVCKKGEVFFEDEDMEGAVYWTTRPGEEQLNAITSGLFAELSVRLALISDSESQGHDVSKQDYINAARTSLAWILRHRYRPRQGLVLDNIQLKQHKRRDWIFTYNTGVAMAVCALLHEVTKDDEEENEEYLLLAHHMAVKAMTRTGPKGWIEDDGVLTEKKAYGRGTHDPMKPNDAVGFKAVLIRQLAIFYEVADKVPQGDFEEPVVKKMIRKFINVNLRSQLERNTNGRGQYGPWWAGPFECPTSHSQMAVLDVLAAARLVNR